MMGYASTPRAGGMQCRRKFVVMYAYGYLHHASALWFYTCTEKYHTKHNVVQSAEHFRYIIPASRCLNYVTHEPNSIAYRKCFA